MDAASALRSCSLFKGFTDTGISIIASICVARAYQAGTPVFVEHMVSDALYVVSDGKVGLTVKGKAGEEVHLGEVGPGDAIGELALISPSLRQCTAIATTAVQAYEIRHADFQKLTTTKPQACIKLMMSICAEIGQRLVDNREALRSLVSR